MLDRFATILIAFCAIAVIYAARSDGGEPAEATSQVSKIGTAFQPHVEPASDEGQRAIATFTVPEGMKAELVAAEPDLANPVAFCFDERGRIS